MDLREVRRCFGRFATGVTVVTFATPEGPHGITVNSFTSVSLEPPLVLVSIDRKTKSHDQLANASFVVNILADDQEAIAWQFAGRPQEGLAMEWEETPQGPRIKGTIGHLECKPWRAYDGGDHTLYLGEVTHFAHRSGDGLGFFGGKFFTAIDPNK
jgi:flavin reductase (DIM6/NTAB) family NADH-FMN oxidoreductase RutF